MPRLKFLSIILIFTLFFSGCAKNSEEKITDLEDLNNSNYKIAAVVGAASEPYVGKVFPKAEEKQFQSVSDMIVALDSKQVDAIVYTRAQLETVVEERPDEFKILDKPVGVTEIYSVISPQTKIQTLQAELNEFLKAKKSDGTLDKMYQYWLVDHKIEMPKIPEIKNSEKKLVAGTLGTSVPNSFYSGDELVGFDIELTKRFAAEYGYELEFRAEPIVSLLADAEFGKIDMISGSIMYTPERAERVIFAEIPLFELPISVMTKKNSAEKESTNFESPKDLNNEKFTVGIITGSSVETEISKILPKAHFKQYSNVSELILALEQKQIDAGADNRPPFEDVLKEKPGKFKILDEPIYQSEVRMVVSPITKIPNLEDQLDEFLIKLKADGTIDRMKQYWMVDHKTEMPNIPAPENPTQTIKVGILGDLPPYNFYVGNELSGFDIEFMKLFAKEYNYNLDYVVADMVSQLTEIEFGKIDMLCGAITYTEERAEHVKFVKTPLFTISSSIIVLNDESSDENFFAGIKNSFEKTLIREDRYKMILDGLKVTLILAFGSLILGTILGFIFCMLKRSSIKIISSAMNFFIALISGLPIVLTLMICFYVIFSGSGLNEIIVAIIAFSIDFGCYIAITLNSGIESVAVGEIEAAVALGLSKFQIYRKIIFPQAIQNIFGVYNRQVISLIKTTSIVGYIAVQDLTKVSDIIRARTYDAFFSLIFTAAIYFLIARICIFILSYAEKKFNGRRKI